MIGKAKERAKDPYMYLKCKRCENIFRVVRSGLDRGLQNGYTGKWIYLACCMCCGYNECDKTTKKEWIKSNEMIPDRRSS